VEDEACDFIDAGIGGIFILRLLGGPEEDCGREEDGLVGVDVGESASESESEDISEEEELADDSASSLVVASFSFGVRSGTLSSLS
jgi:hypothetical protein